MVSQIGEYIICYPNVRKEKESGMFLRHHTSYKTGFKSHEEATEFAFSFLKDVRSNYKLIDKKIQLGDDSKKNSFDQQVCAQYGEQYPTETGKLVNEEGEFVHSWASIFIYEISQTSCFNEHGLVSENCYRGYITKREIAGVLDFESD
jgi:hypothetical protein